MTISTTPSDVRDALDADSTEYSDSELQFEIRQAEAIVNDELAPYSEKTSRLELVATLLAAAYAADEKSVEKLEQESRSVTFSSEESLSLWQQAKQMDPTGRLVLLEKPTASLSVPDIKGLR